MFAAMKNVSVDNRNEKLVAFAQTVDFTELFNHVRGFIGITCSFYQPEITTSRGDVYISFMSDDITAQTGVFAVILKRCNIQSSNNGVYKDRETNELGYWVGVNIRYEHKDGGSNGMEVLRVWYKNGVWIFLNAGERM